MHKSFIVLLCLLSFTACKKEQDCSKPAGLDGEWEWVQSFGGFGGWTITPESEGYRIKLVIDDLLYREYRNDSLIWESQYDLVIHPDSAWNTNTYIEFDNGDVQAIYFDRDTLKLYELHADGFSHEYKRK